MITIKGFQYRQEETMGHKCIHWNKYSGELKDKNGIAMVGGIEKRIKCIELIYDKHEVIGQVELKNEPYFIVKDVKSESKK